MTASVGPGALEQVLALARWAPSGDNTQPWRFEIVARDRVVVHGFDTRHHCVYDLDGSSSWIAHGALIETIAIAASRLGLRVESVRRADAPDTAPLYDVRLVPDPAITADPLIDVIERRSVQRRPLSTRALTDAERAAMDASVGPAHTILWREGAEARRSMAGLLFTSAKLRLTMPEAYRVHRDVIEWGARFSEDRVPEAAVGVDPMTAKLMRQVMKSWSRVTFFNRWLAGTWAPRIQLDVMPALRCAAHFVLLRKEIPATLDDFVDAGRAMQRLWLTATSLDLQFQPEMTPLIFARYSREKRRFSDLPSASASGAAIASAFQQQLGSASAANAVFMGRVGAGRAATSRSLRLPLDRLTYDPAAWPGA